MSKVVTCALLSCLLLNACTVNLTQKAFIAQHQQVAAYTEDQLIQWQQWLPQYKVKAVSTQARDRVQLSGVYLDNPASKELVLFFMGNGMSVSAMPQWWLENMASTGKDLLLFDRRGIGASGGKADIQSLRDDARDKYSYVMQTIQPQSIVLHGFSLGSFIAADLAAEGKVDKLVLQGSATHVQEWLDEVTPWYYQLLVNFDIEPAFFQLNNLQAVEVYQGPLLLIAGENDQQAPASLSRRLLQASRSADKQLYIVPDTGHNGMFKQQTTLDVYKEFLNKG